MKIKSIQFHNHYLLGNLLLNFCDLNGNPVDTVLIAGENGTGKSTILNELYKILTHKVDCALTMDVEINGKPVYFSYYYKLLSNGQRTLHLSINGKDTISFASHLYSEHFKSIFSDVDIHFTTTPISGVTALDVDKQKTSRRSDSKLSHDIQQLLVDIQALDDAELSKAIRLKQGETIHIDSDLLAGRIDRFTQAFDYMFGNTLKYEGIENTGSRKAIAFSRYGKKVYLDELSSGEKQIVYRGSFLLRDLNALNGAIVLLDEPEISMHPEWQKKIMKFYRRMFTNMAGVQTSQIFAVTHSPFILHNDERENDKVIVLSRNDDGQIVVNDKPEYYNCNSVQSISDAFHHTWYLPEQNTVYLEGRTDEKYFTKTVETFAMEIPFAFKWIGHLNASGQEEFTGCDSLDKAYKFSLTANHQVEQVFLFDCDVKKTPSDEKHSHVRIMPLYENPRFKAGVENALCIEALENIMWDDFYDIKSSTGMYGEEKRNAVFRKAQFCDYICSLDQETRENVFVHLREMVNDLVKILSTSQE